MPIVFSETHRYSISEINVNLAFNLRVRADWMRILE